MQQEHWGNDLICVTSKSFLTKPGLPWSPSQQSILQDNANTKTGPMHKKKPNQNSVLVQFTTSWVTQAHRNLCHGEFNFQLCRKICSKPHTKVKTPPAEHDKFSMLAVLVWPTHMLSVVCIAAPQPRHSCPAVLCNKVHCLDSKLITVWKNVWSCQGCARQSSVKNTRKFVQAGQLLLRCLHSSATWCVCDCAQFSLGPPPHKGGAFC